MDGAAMPLRANDTLVGFLDLPARQGLCLISDFSSVLPGGHKISKSSLWGAISEDKPCLQYSSFVYIYVLFFFNIFLHI